MAPKTGKAAVEIVGDVANFGAQVERDLNRELRGVKLNVRPVAKQMSDGIAEGTRASAAHIKGLDAEAKTTLKGIGDEAEKAGKGIGDGVRKGTNQARDDLGRFVKSGAASGAGFALGFGGVSGLLGGIGKAAGTALSLGLKGAALASAANTAAGLVVALAPAVGAVGALAAGMIAAKIAAGVFSLAMTGVSDAVTAGLAGNTAAFNKALKDMPPTAQAAIKEIVGLKDSILGVRNVVQGNFFGPLVGQLKPLGETYLPMISQQLGGIAFGFGKAAASTVGFLRLPSSVASVTSSLSDTRQAVNNVSAGVPGLIRAFLPLWEVGSSFLPGLTGGFDELTQKVGAFMENARETGQLEEFISGGLSVLGELGSVLADVGSILKSVFQAASASGGDLLGVIGQAVGQFAAFLNTAEGMEALTAVFEVLSQVSGVLGTVFAAILPIIGQLVGMLAGALAPLFPVITMLIKALAPVVAKVGEALGALLGPAIGVVVEVLSTLIPILMPIIDALLGALMPVIKALAPVITMLGQVISTILSAALKALMPLVTQLLPVMAQLLIQAITPMVPVLGLLGELFLALMPALVPLIQLFVELMIKGMIPAQKIIPIVAQVLTVLIKVIIAIIKPIAEVIGWVARLISELMKTGSAKNTVAEAWNAIKSVTSSVFGWISSFVSGVWNSIKGAVSSAVNAVKTHVAAQWNAIKSATSTAFNFVRDHVTAQFNAVRNVVTSVMNAVRSVFTAAVNALRSTASSVFSAIRSTISSAVNGIRSTLSGISSIVSSVIGFFGRLRSGISGHINTAVSVVRGLRGKISSAIGNLGGLLTAAGRAVIDGLINGISSRLGALRSKAASAASTIRNLFPFSPAKEGPLSGSGSPQIAGAKIATMIATGLDKQLPAVRSAAMSIAEASRLSTRGLDVSGHGILSAALGSATPTATLPPAQPSGPTIMFGDGSIRISFTGAVPSEEEAFRTGQAVGAGIASTLVSRDVRSQVRTL